ncbi:MAG: YggS family pyridoxal phosphate-dependent enzyme [Lachnospiraceae bacterium]|nr:YggS family pyridoxal phosphate-dependent enzyme [Lachnospiraceae bacterium]
MELNKTSVSAVVENYDNVETRVSAACARAGRDRGEVTLIAVSKTKPIEDIQALIDHGVTQFGENKVQEMCGKEETLVKGLSWHMIGHLQRNKVKYLMGKTCLIHSVDSLRLAQEIQKEAAKADIVCPILMEINIGNEESKGGIPIEEAEVLARQIAELPNLKLKGLMCIAPFVDDPEENRDHFKRMRVKRDELAALKIPGTDIRELSMGMTGDFEVAIEEGATLVRVGTAIFGERDYRRL